MSKVTIFTKHGAKSTKAIKVVFATSLEVHYLKNLCDAISNAFALRLAQDGWTACESHPSNAAAAASTGLQPNKPKLPPLFPEFKSKCCVLTSNDDEICWPDQPSDVSSAKLIRKIAVRIKHRCCNST